MIGGRAVGQVELYRHRPACIQPATPMLWQPESAHRRLEGAGPNGSFIATYGDGANGRTTLNEVSGAALDAAGRMCVVDTMTKCGCSIKEADHQAGADDPGHGPGRAGLYQADTYGKLDPRRADRLEPSRRPDQPKPPLWPPP